MESYIWLIPVLPLAAFIITLILGKWWIKESAHWLPILPGRPAGPRQQAGQDKAEASSDWVTRLRRKRGYRHHHRLFAVERRG